MHFEEVHQPARHFDHVTTPGIPRCSSLQLRFILRPFQGENKSATSASNQRFYHAANSKTKSAWPPGTSNNECSSRRFTRGGPAERAHWRTKSKTSRDPVDKVHATVLQKVGTNSSLERIVRSNGIALQGRSNDQTQFRDGFGADRNVVHGGVVQRPFGPATSRPLRRASRRSGGTGLHRPGRAPRADGTGRLQAHSGRFA